MSSVPEAVDAVVAFIGSMHPNVHDGVPMLWPDEDAIIVGFTRDGPGIVIETSPLGFVQTDQETVVVGCLITCVGGDDTVQPIRNRAFGHYNTIATKIRQDKTLGGAVANARLSSASVNQYLNESGAAVELSFAISFIAFV